MSDPATADPGPFDGPIATGTPAPCRAACPVGTDAAAYVALLADGRLAEAYDVARAPNPLASICGRVCSAPCERACRRGIVDTPIAIRALKRVLTEAHGPEAGDAARWQHIAGPVPPVTKPSVGIVGAGPAGLAAAHDLRLAGHAVTCYERADVAGGMLVHGIPPFRLPRPLIATEIAGIAALGVTVRTGVAVGRDVSVADLLAEHAAVLITVGCGQGRTLRTPGADLPGVIRAVDYLRRANARAEGAREEDGPVVVIGGGSVAFDAARSAWRLQGAAGWESQAMLDAARSAARAHEGAGRDRAVRDAPATVTIIAPEPRRALNVPADELEEAEREGVAVRGELGVRRIVGTDRVEGVEVAPVLSLFDADGRFAPTLDEAHTTVLPARRVVLAIGQQADTSFLDGVDGIEAAPWGGITTDAHGRTTHPRLFAAGDVATGPRDLIDAVAAGQRAAAAIAHALAGGARSAVPPRRAITPPAVRSAPPLDDPARFRSGYDLRGRAELPVLPREVRALTTEVEGALAPDAARAEATRCLRCDEQLQFAPHRCVTCALCVDVCPNGCLALEPSGAGVALLFDDDTCIRCGLCVTRCPTAALGFTVAPAAAPDVTSAAAPASA